LNSKKPQQKQLKSNKPQQKKMTQNSKKNTQMALSLVVDDLINETLTKNIVLPTPPDINTDNIILSIVQ